MKISAQNSNTDRTLRQITQSPLPTARAAARAVAVFSAPKSAKFATEASGALVQGLSHHAAGGALLLGGLISLGLAHFFPALGVSMLTAKIFGITGATANGMGSLFNGIAARKGIMSAITSGMTVAATDIAEGSPRSQALVDEVLKNPEARPLTQELVDLSAPVVDPDPDLLAGPSDIEDAEDEPADLDALPNASKDHDDRQGDDSRHIAKA